MSNSRKLWTVAAVLIVVAAGLAFTSPGHRVLYKLGFAVACDSSCD